MAVKKKEYFITFFRLAHNEIEIIVDIANRRKIHEMMPSPSNDESLVGYILDAVWVLGVKEYHLSPLSVFEKYIKKQCLEAKYRSGNLIVATPKMYDLAKNNIIWVYDQIGNNHDRRII